jgi:hypothetical protein
MYQGTRNLQKKHLEKDSALGLRPQPEKDAERACNLPDKKTESKK